MSAGTKKPEKTRGRPKPKWLDNPNHDRAKRSNRHERRVASEMGGQRIRNSGGARWSKHDHNTDDGDVATPDFHVEAKRTDRKSMSIKREWLDKVRSGARKFGKDPAVVLTFERPKQPSELPEDWIMMPLDVAKRLLGYDDED